MRKSHSAFLSVTLAATDTTSPFCRGKQFSNFQASTEGFTESGVPGCLEILGQPATPTAPGTNCWRSEAPMRDGSLFRKGRPTPLHPHRWAAVLGHLGCMDANSGKALKGSSTELHFQSGEREGEGEGPCLLGVLWAHRGERGHAQNPKHLSLCFSRL